MSNEKNFQSDNVDVLYIILKHLTWRCQIYYFFHELFKYRDFMDNNISRGNHRSVDQIAKFNILQKLLHI